MPRFNQREDFMFASRRKKSNFNPFVEEAPAESQGILTKVVGSIKNTLFPLPRVDEKFEEISFPKRANVGIGNKRHLIFEEAEQQKFDNNSSSRYTEPIDLDIPPRVKRAAADAKVSLPTTKFRSENENFSKTQRTKSSKSPDSSLEFAEVLHRVRSNGKFSPVSQASASPLTRKGFPISPSKSKLDFDSDDFFQVYFEGKMVKDMSRDEVLDGLKWINVTDEMIDDELCYANDDDSELEILKEYLVKKSMQMICENYSFFNL